jgi:hypothetical protein
MAVKMGVATLLDKKEFPGPQVMQDQPEPVESLPVVYLIEPLWRRKPRYYFGGF